MTRRRSPGAAVLLWPIPGKGAAQRGALGPGDGLGRAWSLSCNLRAIFAAPQPMP